MNIKKLAIVFTFLFVSVMANENLQQEESDKSNEMIVNQQATDSITEIDILNKGVSQDLVVPYKSSHIIASVLNMEYSENSLTSPTNIIHRNVRSFQDCCNCLCDRDVALLLWCILCPPCAPCILSAM